MSKIYYDWTPNSMLEVELKTPEDFLKVKETLTRIGIASKKEKKLFQSCHILHKQGRYYITHFLEMFCLDGKFSSITLEDIDRRNAIAHLLEEWGLVKIVSNSIEHSSAAMSIIKVLPYREKSEWALESKYTIGRRS